MIADNAIQASTPLLENGVEETFVERLHRASVRIDDIVRDLNQPKGSEGGPV